MKKMRNFLVVVGITFWSIVLSMGIIGGVYALDITGTGSPNDMPWDTPLCTLEQALTGKTAKAIAMVGLFVAGGLLVFGGELSDFARRVTWMCLAISVMLAGQGFIDMINKDTSTNCSSIGPGTPPGATPPGTPPTP